MWTWVEAMQAALHEGGPGGNRIKDRVRASCSRLAEMDCGGAKGPRGQPRATPAFGRHRVGGLGLTQVPGGLHVVDGQGDMCHSGCRWAGATRSDKGRLESTLGEGQREKLGLSVQPSPLRAVEGRAVGLWGRGRAGSLGGWKTKDSGRKVPRPVNRRGYSRLTYKRRYGAWFNFSSARESWEIGRHGQTREAAARMLCALRVVWGASWSCLCCPPGTCGCSGTGVVARVTLHSVVAFARAGQESQEARGAAECEEPVLVTTRVGRRKGEARVRRAEPGRRRQQAAWLTFFEAGGSCRLISTKAEHNQEIV